MPQACLHDFWVTGTCTCTCTTFPFPGRANAKRALTDKKLSLLLACLLLKPPASQPDQTQHTNTTHCHSIPQQTSNKPTPHHAGTPNTRRASTQSNTRTASHSFTFLANPENPGLLAVVEQSATHHGLFVHAKEAKACALCISIPALDYRRLARRLRPRHLRGPSARIVITASTAHNEQRAKSR